MSSIIDGEIFNFDERQVKQSLCIYIYALKGAHEVTFKPKRNTRRLRANGYYFAATVKMFREYLAAQGQHYSKMQCHRMLGIKVAPIEPLNPVTGELMAAIPPETHTMSILEFYHYVNACNEWLWDAFEINVPPPRIMGAFEDEEKTADTVPTP